VRLLVRRLRRRFGRVEYFAAVEFTTGRAARSGGQRRIHLHLLLKVGDGFDVIEAERLVRQTWKAQTGAIVVEVAALVSPGAALGYLALHHRKPEQAPPVEWRGMTERASRGYWAMPIAELRDQARRELAVEAHAHRTGLSLELSALEVELRGPVRLIEVRESAGASVIEPLGEFPAPLPSETRNAIAEARTLHRRGGRPSTRAVVGGPAPTGAAPPLHQNVHRPVGEGETVRPIEYAPGWKSHKPAA
jgi:hypothetical protein